MEEELLKNDLEENESSTEDFARKSPKRFSTLDCEDNLSEEEEPKQI